MFNLDVMFRFLLISISAFAFLIHHSTSNAHEIELGNLTIKHPMIPIFGSKMKAAAGYFTIVNKTNEADELIMVKTNFANAMIHKSKIDNNGLATMEHVEKVLIPSNSSVAFEQESLHIMFTALKEPLEEYMDQKVTLVFKKLGSKEIEFQVEKVSSKTMNSHKDH